MIAISVNARHPEPRRRRGTSQALNRYRERKRLFRQCRPNVSRKHPFQLRGTSARFASLGMTSRTPLFFVQRRFVMVVLHQRWPHPQEDLKRDRDVIAVIAVQAGRHIVDRELAAEADVDALAMR